LNEIIAVDVGTDVDQRDARTARFFFDDFGNVRLEDFWTATFECFFNDFGSELVGTVDGGVGEDDVESAKTIVWMAVFDDMLNDPVSPLTTCNGIYILQNLLNTRTLHH
jgi:hypothetical protein